LALSACASAPTSPQASASAAIRATPEKTRQDVKELGEDRARTEKALKLLRAGKPGAYEKAIEGLLQAGVARRIASVRAIILESWGRWQRAEGQTKWKLQARALHERGNRGAPRPLRPPPRIAQIS
jgi:hypothetical protein